ncbi:soluble epoxide hydrolase [Hypoxylon trugodes]|uniref:soluble epoxide hydrolase n=1 Tax=Hypoxylon trugodes TaxID=326681 RepID=UPI0021994592|nr:soluble epoxide hydrolase [Hypoxylon trugodes]KAI1386828.1 soluble epoxide hydrolase [Hypoxylon trugodes]
MDYNNWKHRAIEVEPSLRIAYIDCPSQTKRPERGVILLIHGFPQTSYQFRHVIGPFSRAGYRVLVPDYRGAGGSSKPVTGFTKAIMARDLVRLLTALEIHEPVHVIGHDIGGMIAFAMAAKHPSRVASVNWGECPLPGTSVHTEDRTTHAVQQFHFIFHSVPDLPLALVAGRERIYLSHFFQKLAYNTAAIKEEDLDHYVRCYEQPGAMRCAFEVYRAFEQDAKECEEWISSYGKLSLPALCMSGDQSRHLDDAAKMFAEVHQRGTYEVVAIPESGHYIAEENPEMFVAEALRFIETATVG